MEHHWVDSKADTTAVLTARRWADSRAATKAAQTATLWVATKGLQ